MNIKKQIRWTGTELKLSREWKRSVEHLLDITTVFFEMFVAAWDVSETQETVAETRWNAKQS